MNENINLNLDIQLTLILNANPIHEPKSESDSVPNGSWPRPTRTPIAGCTRAGTAGTTLRTG